MGLDVRESHYVGFSFEAFKAAFALVAASAAAAEPPSKAARTGDAAETARHRILRFIDDKSDPEYTTDKEELVDRANDALQRAGLDWGVAYIGGLGEGTFFNGYIAFRLFGEEKPTDNDWVEPSLEMLCGADCEQMKRDRETIIQFFDLKDAESRVHLETLAWLN